MIKNPHLHGTAKRIFPVLIAALLAVLSVRVISTVLQSGGAFAQQSEVVSATGATVEQAPVQAQSNEATTDAETVADEPGQTRSLGAEVNHRLAKRKRDLDDYARSLETRERALEAIETRIDTKLDMLRVEKAELASIRADVQSMKAESFEGLSTTYERMKPREAARIFEIMEDEILVPVAAGMRTQSLSSVLAEMSPEAARALTTKLADHQRENSKSDQVTP
ncbi:MAG: hypothetical protein AAFR21_08080 [Pseudomonadota bacterium]